MYGLQKQLFMGFGVLQHCILVFQVLRRAFRYDWRLWTIPELAEMLEEAGFDSMRAWLRPMKVLSTRT